MLLSGLVRGTAPRLAMAPLDSFIFPDANGGVTTFRENQILFAQGDPADSAFYIREGQIKISVLSEDGKEAVVAIHGAGDFCGEGCSGKPGRSGRSPFAISMAMDTRIRVGGLSRIVVLTP